MFAVIKTGGKQYRVAAEDKLKVEKVAGEPGEIIQFGEVLVVGGDTVTLGTPTVSGASVAAEVVAQERGPKVIAFKKRRRKNSRRKRGHRQEFTLIRISEILLDGAKPTKGAQPKREPKPVEPSVTAGEDEADDKPKTKTKTKTKSAAKSGSAKKPAAKKPAAAKSKSKRQKK
jgi:large subunit ribosomal protein L21